MTTPALTTLVDACHAYLEADVQVAGVLHAKDDTLRALDEQDVPESRIAELARFRLLDEGFTHPELQRLGVLISAVQKALEECLLRGGEDSGPAVDTVRLHARSVDNPASQGRRERTLRSWHRRRTGRW